ncbi:Hsp20/alpha crystallin family protein [Saccharibacillus sp. CPCC 101409]|uniref:Hsp20/alpha crystallin family protein n=1 Tax=Saccharibacillus sp. CPCC 101409 TaxID=3058041 RepID=UPI002670D2BE|nr:Hsp20/alpha crystallin family protein [Saccharibacillus sp. CPCC 101409]MDO3410837.1 Hsp20/alpha crystallin family protein [Saccharibacillus sp. CPCC 101409]
MFEQGPFGRHAEEIFNQLAKTFGDTFGEEFAGPMRERAMSFRTDIHERDGRYWVEAELPGFKKDDIDVDYTAPYLTIRAVRQEETAQEESEQRRIVRSERRFGEFVRRFYIEDADREGIRASLKDGLLKLEIPKRDNPAVKRILIEGED